MIDLSTAQAIMEAIQVFITITNDAREAGYHHLLQELSEVSDSGKVREILRNSLTHVITEVNKRSSHFDYMQTLDGPEKKRQPGSDKS